MFPDKDVASSSFGLLNEIEANVPIGFGEYLVIDISTWLTCLRTGDGQIGGFKSRSREGDGLPVGMAIDTKAGRIFIGCRGPQKLIVMSTRDGKVLADLPIGESVDAIKIVDGQVFASTAGSQLFVAAETAPGKFAIVQTVKTGEGARTMGVDVAARRIYLPSAEYETGANGRRAQKLGTFMLLVAAPQTAT